MEYQELQELLLQAKAEIVEKKGSEIDRNNQVVRKFIDVYFKLKGKKIGVDNCTSCILDAYFELKQLNQTQFQIMSTEKKFKLKRGLVSFDHTHYTPQTMTDSVAIKMVQRNKSNAAYFENAEELLAAAATPAQAAKAAEPVVAKTPEPPVVADKSTAAKTVVVTEKKPEPPAAQTPKPTTKKPTAKKK